VIEAMGFNQEIETSNEVIGLIPACGQGSRLGPLPCSKEIYLIGFNQVKEGRPKVICSYLLEKMCLTGIKKANIVLRVSKWDIPAYLRDGKGLGIDIAYLALDAPCGVPLP
jgi:glucose-1-phosphate thymidylyltransferase